MNGIKENKKAWIRIAEAAIAIILLASVILVLMTRQAKPQDIAGRMYSLQHAILDEASKNESIREGVLAGNLYLIEPFIRERLPQGFGFNISVCNPAELCQTTLPEKEIYVDDVLISSTLDQYGPKKLRFYIWIGEPIARGTKTCQSLDFSCCQDCVSGTEHSEFDANCLGGGVCCEICVAPECIGKAYGEDCSGTCTICDGIDGCINTPAGEDYLSECDGIDCAAAGYYFGWLGASCHYSANVNSPNHNCDGTGSCESAEDACPTQPQGSAASACGSKDCINPATCQGKIPGICFTSGQHDCPDGWECDLTGTCISVGGCVSGDHYSWSGTCGEFCNNMGGTAVAVGYKLGFIFIPACDDTFQFTTNSPGFENYEECDVEYFIINRIMTMCRCSC